MLFNVGKCNVMHIGNCELQRQYFMENQKLEVVHQEKDLGVVISNDLKVSQQCQHRIIKPLEYLDSLTEQLNTDIQISYFVYTSL